MPFFKRRKWRDMTDKNPYRGEVMRSVDFGEIIYQIGFPVMVGIVAALWSAVFDAGQVSSVPYGELKIAVIGILTIGLPFFFGWVRHQEDGVFSYLWLDLVIFNALWWLSFGCHLSHG